MVVVVVEQHKKPSSHWGDEYEQDKKFTIHDSFTDIKCLWNIIIVRDAYKKQLCDPYPPCLSSDGKSRSLEAIIYFTDDPSAPWSWMSVTLIFHLLTPKSTVNFGQLIDQWWDKQTDICKTISALFRKWEDRGVIIINRISAPFFHFYTHNFPNFSKYFSSFFPCTTTSHHRLLLLRNNEIIDEQYNIYGWVDEWKRWMYERSTINTMIHDNHDDEPITKWDMFIWMSSSFFCVQWMNISWWTAVRETKFFEWSEYRWLN